MAFDEDLADRVRDVLARRADVAEKKMFGGLAFLLNGNMLVGVWQDALIVRLGPGAAADALLEPHVGEFDVTGRPMTGWVLVGPAGVADDDRVAGWVRRAEAFVGTLPAKQRPVYRPRPESVNRPARPANVC